MKKFIILIIVAAAIAAGFIFTRDKSKPANEQPKQEPESEEQKTFSFSNPKKSAHYETNAPGHGSILPGVPVSVVIDFNFDLAPPSSISIKKDGKDYGAGETKIDSNKLAMRRSIDLNAPDGVYSVEYRACWPDKSCHDGHFQFAIARELAKTFTDLRGKSEVIIDMKDIKFVPQNFIIDHGTKVIWKNSDEVDHYVNTDSHPAHSHFSALNSRALKKGETFEFTLEEYGVYPYHCSAHEAVMKGMILVD